MQLWEHKLLNSGTLNSNGFVDVKKEDGNANAIDAGLSNAPVETPALALPQPEQGVKRKAEEMEETAEETEKPEEEGQGEKETEKGKEIQKTEPEKEKGETLSSDSDDEAHGAGVGVDVQSGNLVLAQFDKVSHTKNKWKCSLKGGVMTLNNKDMLFGKATGEFTW